MAASAYRDVPAWRLFATLGDTSCVWWFVFLALVLLYTPPGPRQGMARWLPTVTVVSGVVFQVMALLRSTPLDRPREELSSPLAVPAISGAAELVGAVAIYALAACLLASVVLLVRAWRRAEGESRRQLLWLVAGALPLAPAVIAAFALSIDRSHRGRGPHPRGAMVALVVGAGLSVLRYRLYDVERVVTESAAYAVASAAVLLVYVGVVVVLSRSGPVDAGSQLTTVAATLAGVGVARVSYVWGRRAVGRRVNPARFHAVEVVRAGLTHPSADLDELVAQALGDGARVVYPVSGGGWVTSDGRAVEASAEGVHVRRHEDLVARLEFDPHESGREVVEAVAREAAAEMDNVALRAELARQVELIRESRARLSTAHLEERRRIERDLHDGAQQRLLAIALQLQSARLNGDGAVLVAEADRAITGLQATVQELRTLAAGLQPAALAGGGLLAAVADLAARAPAGSLLRRGGRALPVRPRERGLVRGRRGGDERREALRRQPGRRPGAPDGGVALPSRFVTKASVPRTPRAAVSRDSPTGSLRSAARCGSAEVDPHGTVVEAVFPCAS